MSQRLFDQNTEKLFTSLLIACLMTGSLAASVGSSPQPPIDPTVYNVATIGQPVRIDPARAYDTASGELLQNVYQTLIWYSDKHPVVFTPGVGYNLSIADYSDLAQYKPVLASEVPTTENGRLVINASGSYWRFTINTTATYQPWTAANGSIMTSRPVTAEDVVYSFRRQVIYDSYYSPVWMWMTPAFGISGWSPMAGGPYSTYGNGTFQHAADEVAAGLLIQGWCHAVGNDVYFYFQHAWSENIMKQLFSQTWGSIVDPDWVKEMGGWDGLFTTGVSDSNMAAGWTNNYHGKPTSTRSELDTYKSPTTFPGHGSKYATFKLGAVGTGPYRFTSWDTVNKIWRIDYDPNYWMGWADAGDKMGNFFHTVIWKGIDTWPTRKMLFLEGEFDVCAVPRANMYDLLSGDTHTPIAGINLVYNIAALQNDVMLFSFSVPSESPYQSYVGYPTHKTGQLQFFFNNTHIRRAFAWALNYTAYLKNAWFGEAIAERTWWVEGLSPASYKNTNASMPQRDLNLTAMQEELNQAVIDGFNVGTEGFEMSFVYHIGNEQARIAYTLIAQAFQNLGSKYKCNVVGYDWPFWSYTLDPGWEWWNGPMYDVGWLGDFADPDNFCEPYQASWGAFCSGQFERVNNAMPEDQAFVDQEINAALVEPDSAKREAMYQDLQYRYWLDVPSFPLIQPVGRRWARDWVQGWYFNALLPGLYAYDLWKSTSALENVDVDMTATVTPATPTYNPVYIFHNQMRKGNGDASAASMTYTLHVVRNDANDAITTLYAAVGLTRSFSGDKQFANGTYVALLVGGSASATLIWWEDGTNQVMAGNTAGIPYDVAGEAYPINANANDTDRGNNQQPAGTLVAKTLTGDTTGNGFIDIFDAIQLSNAFGTVSGDRRWNPEADFNGSGGVDIYDAILLSGNFNNHVP